MTAERLLHQTISTTQPPLVNKLKKRRLTLGVIKIGFTKMGFFASVLLIAACTLTPEQRITKICTTCHNGIVHVNGLPIPYLIHNATNASSLLHVYLEGDGKPWVRGGTRPAKNPSSHQLTALRLMQLDQAKSVYLHRPCYGLKQIPESCHEAMWTHGRYSKEVLALLNSALDHLKQRLGASEFILVGHSGGGTLAMLLAHARGDVKGVITVAGNLDPEAWAKHFQYLPLSTSLNPSHNLPLPQTIKRLHLVGEQDRSVPAQLTKKAARIDTEAEIALYSDFDHTCCWETIWEETIAKMRKDVEESPSQ